MARNIYNPTTGATGFQVEGGPLPAGWQWMSSPTMNPSNIDNMPTYFQNPDGSLSPSHSGHYGYLHNQDLENVHSTELQNLENAAPQSGLISSGFMKNEIISHPDIVAFYINALTYGGYTIGDVLNDMKRRELVFSGNSQASSMAPIIDPEMERTEYLQTAQGQKSVSDTAAVIPTFNMQGLMDPEILKYGSNIPDELFTQLSPLLDNNSQEFKDAVANIKSAYFDLANASLQASTEQEKAIADTNLKEFKRQLEEKYGIALSDDAMKAWTQIEGIQDTYNTRGLAQSGLQTEAVDNVLATTRKQDQRLRNEKLTAAEQQKAAYYTSSASAAEIAALTPEERAKYGLAPSADILSQFDMATLRAKYPDETEASLKAKRDAVLDENGNYRSTLYQKYYSGVSTNQASADESAKAKVRQMALDDEEKKYAPYSTDSVLNVQPSGTGSTGSNLVKDTSGDEPNAEQRATMKAQLDAAQKAVQDIQARVNPGAATSYSAPATTYKAPVSTYTPSTTSPTSSEPTAAERAAMKAQLDAAQKQVQTMLNATKPKTY